MLYVTQQISQFAFQSFPIAMYCIISPKLNSVCTINIMPSRLNQSRHRIQRLVSRPNCVVRSVLPMSGDDHAGDVPFFPSFPLPSLSPSSPSPSPSPFPFLPRPSLPFRSWTPLIQLGRLGERCELPQRGLGQSPSRNRIWCISALKCDIR